MANVNSFTISGNLTRDLDVRWIDDEGKSAVVGFGIAVNRRRWDKATEDYVEEVSFFDCEAFGGFAVLLAKKLKKADAVTVQGRLKQDQWENNGEKRSKVVLVAEQVDGAAMYRAKDEDNAVALTSREGSAAPAESAPATEAEKPAAAPSSDDIPF